MEYKEFEKIITNLQKSSERSHNLYKLGIDLMDYSDLYYDIIGALLLEVFGVEGKDWIDWFLYERPGFHGGKPLEAYDKDGNVICDTIKSLWETVNEYLNEKNN